MDDIDRELLSLSLRRRVPDVGFAAVSALLSGFGAAWMIGGMFRGEQARAVGMLGALVGAALIYAATRWRSAIFCIASMLPRSVVSLPAPPSIYSNSKWGSRRRASSR